jgi:hypothetical protein
MDTGRSAIDIVIESGMIYLAVQLVFVVLFAIRHPAQGIVGVIAVQIYVRNRHLTQYEGEHLSWLAWLLKSTTTHRASHHH